MASAEETPGATFAGVALAVCLPVDQLDEELAESLRDAAAAGAKLVEGAALDVPPPDGVTHVLTNALSHGVCAGLERGDGPAAVSIDWLCNSLDAGRLFPAWPHAAVESVLHRPAIAAGGIPGAAELKVAQTNFRGDLRSELQMMVETMGATHTKDLKKDNTHLLCHTFEGAKYDRGTQWGLSAVNHHWLEDCIWQWKILPAQPYMNLPGKAVSEAAEAKGGRLFQPPMCAADNVEDSVMETALDVTEAGVADSGDESEEVKRHGGTSAGATGAKGADAVPAATPAPALSDETNDSGAEAGRDVVEARPDVTSPLVSSMPKSSTSPGTKANGRTTPVVSPAALRGTPKRPSGELEGMPEGDDDLFEDGDACAAGDDIMDGDFDADEGAEAEAADGSAGADEPSPAGKVKSQAKRSSLREVSQNALDALETIGKTKGNKGSELEGKPPADAKGNKAAPKARNKSEPTQPQGKKKVAKAKAEPAAKGDKGKKRKAEETGAMDVRVTLSGMHTDERNKYTAICGELGIKLLCESRHDEGKYRYDKQVTHVVATSPLGRTAKLLYAMASGAWVLRTDWLDECAAAGKLVDEAPYEWCQTSAKGGAGKRVDLGAPRRWRELRVSTGKRPLEGLQVCLIGTFEARVGALLRGIVSAGGATLKTGSRQDCDVAVFATRCVGAKGAVIGSPSLIASAEELKEAGVACVAQEFVLDWLAMPKGDLGVHVLLDSQQAAQGLLMRCLQSKGQTPNKAAKKPRRFDSF